MLIYLSSKIYFDKIIEMSKKKIFFWAFIGLLLLFNGFLILYETKIQKPQANITPRSSRRPVGADLIPQYIEFRQKAEKLNFDKEETIFSFEDSSYIYKFPIFIKGETSYLIAGRGKNSERINEIIISKSSDLQNWDSFQKINKYDFDNLLDIEAQKTKKGFYIFYIAKKEDRHILRYLFSKDNSSWEDKTIVADPKSTKISLLEDSGLLRLFLLSSDQKTIKQIIYLPDRGWRSSKELVKLSLKIDDFSFMKKKGTYYLLFSINNELYFSPSPDLHYYQKSQNLFGIPEKDFSFADPYLVYFSSPDIYIRKTLN